MRKNNFSIKDHLVKSLKIPGDIAFQECFINLEENQNIVLQNFYNILEFTNQEIIIQTKKNKIRIKGKRLEIVYFTKEEIQISGDIEIICYE